MEDLRIGDVVSVTTGRAPGRVAASMGDRRVTYTELDAATEQLVRALSKRGVEAGHRVVWWGETTLDVLPLSFAIAELGAVFVPINPRFTAAEAGPVLDVADPTIVITDGHHAGGRRVGRPDQRHTVGRDPDAPLPRDRRPRDLLHQREHGRPKGVVLSHRATRLRTMGDATPVPIGPAVCMFPQFHMAGWQGRRPRHGPRPRRWSTSGPTPSPSWRPSTNGGRARLYAIPAVWRRILEADRDGFDTSSLRFADTGTSATTPELLRRHRRSLPRHPRPPSTTGRQRQAACAGCGPRTSSARPASVGPPATGVRGAPDRRGRAGRPQPAAHERLLPRTPRRRPRRSSTGGSTPATWPSGTRRGTTRSSAGRATSSARRGVGGAGRGRQRHPDPSGRRRRSRRRGARRGLGRDRDGIRRAAAPGVSSTCPRCGPTARAAWPPISTPAG